MWTRIVALVIGLSVLAVADGWAADNNCFATRTDCVDFGPHRLPTSVAEFDTLQRTLMGAETPQLRAYAAAALFLYAAMVRSYDDALGSALLVRALEEAARGPATPAGGQRWSKAKDYFVQRLHQRPELVGSYAVGADAKAGYPITPTAPGTLRFRAQTKYVSAPSSGATKVFVCTPGAKTCRPMNVTRDAKGVWRVSAFSSITIGF
jgi:hypothetical protein